ncbi:MAG: ATP-binding protein [Cyanobacteria bacterium J06639_1]
MIAIPYKTTRRTWNTISFVSTLYVRPVLDLLVAEVPHKWQAEVRLGLQEALINAVKHGNLLDPSKRVSVKFACHDPLYQWIVEDEGNGFQRSDCFHTDAVNFEEGDVCGRGVFILHHVFDRIEWNSKGDRITLCKTIHAHTRQPAIR